MRARGRGLERVERARNLDAPTLRQPAEGGYLVRSLGGGRPAIPWSHRRPDPTSPGWSANHPGEAKSA